MGQKTETVIKKDVLRILRTAVTELNDVRDQAERSDAWPLTTEAAYVGVERVLAETQIRFKVGRYNAGGGSDTV